MKIFFSKKEYKILLEMMEIANWVLSSSEFEDAAQEDSYNDLEQKILSHAKSFGLEEHIVFDKRLNKYFTTQDFEERCILNHIDHYDNEIFWDELVNRLAKRDLLKNHSEQEIKDMDFTDYIQKVDEHEKKYGQEFEKHGLERLVIKEESV